MTELGREEALIGAKALAAKSIKFDVAYTSVLTRAQSTLAIILNEIGVPELETIKNVALNERDYGDLSGSNKDEARAKYGEEQVHIWRRSYDVPPPGGESLEMTAARVLPYYEAEILPRIKRGENVLVAAHGNSLRAMIMQIENISKDNIVALELATGVPMIYTLDSEGKFVKKEILERALRCPRLYFAVIC